MHISRYVVDDEASEKEFPQGVRDKGRAGRRLDDFERDPQAVIAGLKKPELAALRVYTSPAFPEINDPLRDQTRFRERRPHPLPVTVALIVRALKKLRKIGAADSAAVQALTLWRGMKNVRVTDEASSLDVLPVICATILAFVPLMALQDASSKNQASEP